MRMKSIVICGSKRFKPEIKKLVEKLTKNKVTVYAPYLHEGKDEWQKMSEQYRKFIALGLTHDHFYKIRMADVVYIYNKDGYAGVSTTLELGCAVALGKPIYAYSNTDQELCRQVLYREIITSVSELMKRLR